ncbi:MAG: serine/threonine protein kinase [Lentisphaeraceae bacterium]|nr:serine/threonine protein kinase [Lentisphaeraceae bacterium]
MTNNSLTINFAGRKIRLQSKLVIMVVALSLFTITFFTIRKLEIEIKQLTRASLEQTLRANAESILQWLDRQKDEIIILASNDAIVSRSEKVYEDFLKNGLEKNFESEAFKSLDASLQSVIQNSDNEDYYIFDENLRFIASSDRNIIGMELEDDGDFIGTLEHQILLKLPSFSVLDKEKNGPVFMVVAKKLKSKKPLYLGFRLQPEESFSRVLRASQSGETGETYAINKDAMMISNSRFVDDLKKSGLLDKTHSCSVLRINLKDDQGELLTMARNALSNNESVTYPNIGHNLEGYKGYRGIDVVGAWTFFPEYGFAICAEVEKAEEYSSLSIIRWNFRGVLLLAAFLGAGIVWYSRKTVKMQSEINKAQKEAKELGQYKLQEKLGEGGMGIVYKATHKMMHRETALKLLKKGVCNDRDIKLFENEVKLTCKLKCFNTINLFDYGKTDDGSFYYVMEYLDGVDIDLLVKQHGPLQPARVIHFLIQACKSLKEAHEIGLVHRDIKGQNMIICNLGGDYDVLKVLDFGLVKEMSDNSNAMIDQVSGTPRFMSPESVVNPKQVNHLTDIYALGVLAYFMLTSEYPYEADTAADLCMKHVQEDVKRPSSETQGKDIPKDLDDIVFQCLAKDMVDRPQSAKVLIELLETCEVAGNWKPEHAQKWWGKAPSNQKEITQVEGLDQTILINLI